MQNLKDNKSKPVRDEYEYVSDEGELKIDEFPIRRKKTSARRDQSRESATFSREGTPQRDMGSRLTRLFFLVILSLLRPQRTSPAG